jgi:heme/copper-type cytochrome/quinol oxidase subunit 4
VAALTAAAVVGVLAVLLSAKARIPKVDRMHAADWVLALVVFVYFLRTHTHTHNIETKQRTHVVVVVVVAELGSICSSASSSCDLCVRYHHSASESCCAKILQQWTIRCMYQ